MKSWSGITGSAQYQALSPDQQSQVRDAYYNTVLVPAAKAQGIRGADLGRLKTEFYSSADLTPTPSPRSGSQSEQKGLTGWVENLGSGAAAAGKHWIDTPISKLWDESEVKKSLIGVLSPGHALPLFEQVSLVKAGKAPASSLDSYADWGAISPADRQAVLKGGKSLSDVQEGSVLAMGHALGQFGHALVHNPGAIVKGMFDNPFDFASGIATAYVSGAAGKAGSAAAIGLRAEKYAKAVGLATEVGTAGAIGAGEQAFANKADRHAAQQSALTAGVMQAASQAPLHAALTVMGKGWRKAQGAAKGAEEAATESAHATDHTDIPAEDMGDHFHSVAEDEYLTARAGIAKAERDLGAPPKRHKGETPGDFAARQQEHAAKKQAINDLRESLLRPLEHRVNAPRPMTVDDSVSAAMDELGTDASDEAIRARARSLLADSKKAAQDFRDRQKARADHLEDYPEHNQAYTRGMDDAINRRRAGEKSVSPEGAPPPDHEDFYARLAHTLGGEMAPGLPAPSELPIYSKGGVGYSSLRDAATNHVPVFEPEGQPAAGARYAESMRSKPTIKPSEMAPGLPAPSERPIYSKGGVGYSSPHEAATNHVPVFEPEGQPLPATKYAHLITERARRIRAENDAKREAASAKEKAALDARTKAAATAARTLPKIHRTLDDLSKKIAEMEKVAKAKNVDLAVANRNAKALQAARTRVTKLKEQKAALEADLGEPHAKAQAGRISPHMAATLGVAATGAIVGAMLNQHDPAVGLLEGALAGLGMTLAAPALWDAANATMRHTVTGIDKAIEATAKAIPNVKVTPLRRALFIGAAVGGISEGMQYGYDEKNEDDSHVTPTALGLAAVAAFGSLMLSRSNVAAVPTTLDGYDTVRLNVTQRVVGEALARQTILKAAEAIWKLGGKAARDGRVIAATEDPKAYAALSGDEKKAVDVSRAFYDETAKAALQHGVIDNVLENYVPHAFDLTDPATRDFFQTLYAAKGRVGDPAASRYRKLPVLISDILKNNGRVIYKGREYDLKLKTLDAGHLLSAYGVAVYRAIEDVKLAKSLKKAGIITEDAPGTAEYTTIDNPAFRNDKGAPYKVRSDFAPYINTVVRQAAKAGLSYRALSGLAKTSAALKSVQLAASFFHAKALGIVGMLVGGSTPKDLAAAMARYAADVDSEEVQMKIRHGMTFSTPELTEGSVPTGYQGVMRRMSAELRAKGHEGAADKMDSLNHLLMLPERLTFGAVMAGVKLDAFDRFEARAVNALDHPPSDAELNHIRDNAARFANHLAGGQNWVGEAFRASGRIEHALLLAMGSAEGRMIGGIVSYAADWLYSTLNIAAESVGLRGNDPMFRRIGALSMTRSLAIGAGVAYAISSSTGGHWSPQDPFGVTYDDGTHIDLFKHMSEPFHAAEDPGKFAANKESALVADAIKLSGILKESKPLSEKGAEVAKLLPTPFSLEDMKSPVSDSATNMILSTVLGAHITQRRPKD